MFNDDMTIWPNDRDLVPNHLGVLKYMKLPIKLNHPNKIDQFIDVILVDF